MGTLTPYLGLYIADENEKGFAVSKTFRPNFTKLDQECEKLELRKMQTENTVADLIKSPGYKIGDIVELLGYYTAGDGAGHQRILSDTDDGSGVVSGNKFWNIVHNGEVNVSWFGAKGDDSNDDIDSIDKANNYTSANKINYDNNKTYRISRTLVIPPYKTTDLGRSSIRSMFDSGNVLEYYADPTGRPNFTIIGDRATISGRSSGAPTESLNGLWVNSSGTSKIEGLVFSGIKGHCIVMGATGERDIINFNMAHIETNTGKGIKMMSGLVDGVEYQEITTGRISESFITCTGDSAFSLEVMANESGTGEDKSIFGFTFDRVSFNSVFDKTGRMGSLYGTGKSTIRDFNFYNCEGEVRGDSNLFLWDLQNVKRSFFDMRGYTNSRSGVRLKNCSDTIFQNFVNSNLEVVPSGRIFIFEDSNCVNNKFINCDPLKELVSVDFGYDTAPSNSTIWDTYTLNGVNTKFEGLIKSDVYNIFNIKKMKLLNSDKKLIHPDLSYAGNFEIVGENVKANLSTSGFSIYNLEIGNVFLDIEYVIDSVQTGTWKIITNLGTPNQKAVTLKTNEVGTHKMAFMFKNENRTIALSSTDSSQNLEITFKKFNINKGGFAVLDSFITSYKEDDYLYNLYGTSEDRPINPLRAARYFDRNLNKSIYWNGSGWVNFDGSNVPSVTMLDTPYYTSKMQQEGVYTDFVTYMDKKHEYDKQLKNQDVVDGVNNLMILEEPKPSQKLVDFKDKYLP